MRSLFSNLLLGTLLMFSITLTCKADGLCGNVEGVPTDPETAEAISDEEFLSLIKNGQCVLHKRIQATAILGALRWAQESAKQNQPLPGLGIGVQYSKVEGLAALGDSKSLLTATPVGELSPDIANIYKEIGVDKVIEIPISLTIVSSTFTDKYSYPIRFDNFLFKENVTFSESKFKNSGVVSFSKTVFYKQSNFINTTFESLTGFNNAWFKGAASFYGATIQNGAEFLRSTFQQGIDLSYATLQGLVKFNQSEFRGNSSFEEATFQGQIYLIKAVLHGALNFKYTTFKEGAFFTELNGEGDGVVKFYDTSFQGWAYFTNSHLHHLLFFPGRQVEAQSKNDQGLIEATSHVSFVKRAVFHGLHCDVADFSYTEFRDHVDFSDARFASYADFSNASFASSVDFFETDFPRKNGNADERKSGTVSGLVIDNAEIQKPLNLKWEQIKDSVNTQTPATWRRLEELFKQEDDLVGQNESKYQEMYLEGCHEHGLSKFSNRLQFLFWGYGVRPWRLTGLILILFSIFTGIYFTQTKSLGKGRGKIKGWWERIKFASTFSALNSVRFNYGYQRSRTTAFKVLTLIQALGFKVLLFFLLKSFANVIPVLNELATKLLPF